MSRRRFLGVMAAAAVAPTLLVPRRSLAEIARPRELSFYHTHTDEKLSLVYFADGRYVQDSLLELDRFLRDHRTGDVEKIDPALFDVLHGVASATASRGVFEVISGYRSPASNEMLRAGGGGVARKSLHMQGKAIDVRLTDVETTELRECAVELACGGVGYYHRSNFVHLDTGRVRTW
jgi:uncharacterized protein YcbK (DUF882 family)